MTSYYSRTTAEIKKITPWYWKVEYPNVFAGIKVDLFNIIDLLVLHRGVLGIQVCGSDFAPHKKKIMEEHKKNTIAWLSEGQARLEVWGWRQLKKKRGGKAMFWSPRIADVLIFENELIWRERD